MDAPSGMVVGGRPQISKGNFGWWLMAAAIVYLLATGRLMHYLQLATVPAATTTSSTTAASGSASVTSATSSASAAPTSPTTGSGGSLQLVSLPALSASQGSAL